MTHVATLICDPQRPALDTAAIARARAALPFPDTPDWLAPSIAVDIPFHLVPGSDTRALADRVHEALTGVPIDVVVQPAAARRKGLFVADMDSTMIQQECVDELASYAGLKDHVAAITERAMRGEIAFEPALRERVALLQGLPVSVIDEVLRERISLMPGGRTLVATMRANGAYTCLVSGGFTGFVDRIASMLGFDESRANTLEVEAGALSGRVREPILGREAKRVALVELRDRLSLSKNETLAIGDGANDLDMLLEAGLGVAYHAKPKVVASAAARIDHGDLTALLYAQGYRRDEFVEQ
jgi:phosphoserine phosphatase